MPSAWFSLKRFRCKSELSDVHDPKGSSSETREPSSCRSGCSAPITKFIHGSKRHVDKAPIGNPRSSRSSVDILNPVTHQIVFTESKFKLLINTKSRDHGSGKGGSGASDPSDCQTETEPVYNGRRSFSLSRMILGEPPNLGSRRTSLDAESRGFVCPKCGEKLKKLDALEAHHLTRHTGKIHSFTYVYIFTCIYLPYL